MKVNCVYESIFVLESTCTNLDGFDPAVDAFGGAITPLQDDGIENSVQVIFDRFSRFFHGFKSTAHGQFNHFVQDLCAQTRVLSCHRFRAVSLIAQARAIRVCSAWNAVLHGQVGRTFEPHVVTARQNLIPTLSVFFVRLSPNPVTPSPRYLATWNRAKQIFSFAFARHAWVA